MTAKLYHIAGLRAGTNLNAHAVQIGAIISNAGGSIYQCHRGIGVVFGIGRGGVITACGPVQIDLRGGYHIQRPGISAGCISITVVDRKADGGIGRTYPICCRAVF